MSQKSESNQTENDEEEEIDEECLPLCGLVKKTTGKRKNQFSNFEE